MTRDRGSNSDRGGRPRSERAHTAILAATMDLLTEGGFPVTTIEAIAARAGVSKVTIYKWWPNRGAVAIEAFFTRYRTTIEFEDTGDVARDVTKQIRVLTDTFTGRPGQIMAELIGYAQTDNTLAQTLRSTWLQPRRDATATVLRAAIERDQIKPDTDLETLMDQLYAPIYFRLLMRHEPLTPTLAETLVRTVLDGIRTT